MICEPILTDIYSIYYVLEKEMNCWLHIINSIWCCVAQRKVDEQEQLNVAVYSKKYVLSKVYIQYGNMPLKHILERMTDMWCALLLEIWLMICCP